jgi:hypothetical protein
MPVPFDSAPSRRMIAIVRVPRLWPGFLSILLLLCIGVGLVSAAVPDDAAVDSGYNGYFDGDGDDAVAAPERLAVLMDVAAGARAAVVAIRTPEPFDGPAALIIPLVVDQSPPPLLRSPPPG